MPRLARVPIVVVTSRTADKHRSLALSLGANVFLGKPYQEDILLGHVRELIAQAPAVRHSAPSFLKEAVLGAA
jgi:chemosensory pili system protein ChpA (sensor histidine kinase/response regulator)